MHFKTFNVSFVKTYINIRISFIRLIIVIDLFQTALHWAAKRGDENLVKLLAGANKKLVNTKSVSIP